VFAEKRGNSIGYNYDAMGRLTQIRDTGRSFTAAVTNDWNGNITEVAERWGGGNPTVSTFTYDNENRLTEFTIGNSGFSADHTYDGFNRLIKTDATVGVNTTNYEHTYDVKRHLGNIDVTNQQQPVNGKVWRWEGGAGTPSADPSGTSGVAGKPIESPQRSSQSNTQYYMLNDERTIEKRSYQVGGVVAGDTNDDSRYAEWQHVNGAAVPTRVAIGIPSELFNAYNITLDADRASSAATSQALQLGATDLEYEVTRVKSPVIGRDMNPMGRGDGTYYANGGNVMGGSVAITRAKSAFVGEKAFGYGSSVNNQYGPVGPGMGGIGPLGEERGEEEEQPPRHFKPRFWKGKKDKDGDTPIHYYDPLCEACKSSMGSVCDRYIKPPRELEFPRSSYLHQCCTDGCTLEAARRAAIRVNKACRNWRGQNECEAIIVDLPATIKQALTGQPPYRGIIVAFNCSPSLDNVTDIVRCWCQSSAMGLMAWGFRNCLIQVLGIGPGCSGVDGGDGSWGDGIPWWPEGSCFDYLKKRKDQGGLFCQQQCECALACGVITGGLLTMKAEFEACQMECLSFDEQHLPDKNCEGIPDPPGL